MVSIFMKINLAIFLIIVSIFVQFIWSIMKPLPVPEIDWNSHYWGPGNHSDYIENPAIKPFQIEFDKNAILDLKQQLHRNISYHPPLEGVAFEFGFNAMQIVKLIKYWRDEYLPKYQERVKYLNQFQHFKTQIQGLEIHFLHHKPDEKLRKTKKVYPLLILHGWPGSICEFYDIIPKLTSPSDDHDYVFEVIAPSLPGFAWSQGSSKPGYGPIEMSILFRKLMQRLGHEKFFLQAGDWGSVISNALVTFFPDNVIGYHSNMCWMFSPLSTVKLLVSSLWTSWVVPKEYEDFFFPFSERLWLLLREGGYFHLQATKPDTVGIIFTDNPIGTAAYILEKFAAGTNINYLKLPDGGYEIDFNMDALLDNIMIYYLTNTMTTSIRIYSEGYTAKQQSYQLERVATPVPVGCGSFFYDIGHNLDWALSEKFPNLIHRNYYRNAGHFAAMQVPDILYRDLIEFIGKVFKQQNDQNFNKH